MLAQSTSERNYSPPNPRGLPGDIPEKGGYSVEFAHTESELKQIQRLRYRVFNLEMDEGLNTSRARGMDVDAFDPFCHHLFVRHLESRQIVGTYRMQTTEMADSGRGFYAETEFDFSTMPADLIEESVEIGRACIAREHRSLNVLYLLWKGLGLYASHNKKRHLFGCCSLTSQVEQEGVDTYSYLRRKNHLHPDIWVSPITSHICAAKGSPDPVDVKLPRLMKTYLSLGAKICSGPAIDRDFKTIDFLALFDFDSLVKSDLAFYNFQA